MNKLKTAAPNSSIMLISVDEHDDEFVCLAQVPKVCVMLKPRRCLAKCLPQGSSLKANEWVDQLKAVFTGAKGGGKDETAQMSGKGVAQVCSHVY